MTIVSEFIIGFLRHYGPTSLALFDLMLYPKESMSPEPLLQHIEHLLRQEIIVTFEGRRVGARRAVPSLALKGQLQ